MYPCKGQTVIDFKLCVIVCTNLGNQLHEFTRVVYPFMSCRAFDLQFPIGNAHRNSSGWCKKILQPILNLIVIHAEFVVLVPIDSWDEASELVIYDNKPGEDDEAELDASTVIGGGSIVIHKG